MLLKSVESGSLRSRLNVQIPVQTRDARGGVVTEWAQVSVLFCSFQPIADPMTAFQYRQTDVGKVTMFAGQRQETATHLVLARAQTFNLLPEMRFVKAWAEPNGLFRVFSPVCIVPVQDVRHSLRLLVKENQGLPITNVATTWNVVVDSLGNFVYDSVGQFVVSRG